MLLALAGCTSGPQVTDSSEAAGLAAWEQDTLDWRHRREQRLTEPFGWLSLVGMEFLDPGRYRVGVNLGSDIQVPSGPAFWGEIQVDDEKTRFEFNADSGLRLVSPTGVEPERTGRPSTLRVVLDDAAGPVLIEAGTSQLQLMYRAGQPVLRVRDSQAATRTEFAGLHYFPMEADWRIVADWQAHPPGQTIPIASVLGDLIEEPNPGRAVFVIDGASYSLEAVASTDQLFFIFADRTSGRETYGLGRFLYADLPSSGEVVLDFNRAYNPPCAFSEFTTCPLPPPENRLDLRVPAGELAYEGGFGVSEVRAGR